MSSVEQSKGSVSYRQIGQWASASSRQDEFRLEFGRDDFSLVRAVGEACLGELRHPVELPRLSSSIARLLGSSMILDSIPMLFETPGDMIT